MPVSSTFCSSCKNGKFCGISILWCTTLRFWSRWYCTKYDVMVRYPGTTSTLTQQYRPVDNKLIIINLFNIVDVFFTCHRSFTLRTNHAHVFCLFVPMVLTGIWTVTANTSEAVTSPTATSTWVSRPRRWKKWHETYSRARLALRIFLRRMFYVEPLRTTYPVSISWSPDFYHATLPSVPCCWWRYIAQVGWMVSWSISNIWL